MKVILGGMAEPCDYDFLVRIAMVGDSGVGKSALVMRAVEDTFDNYHIGTIGLDFRIHRHTTDDGKRLKLQLWDTAGQERFKVLTKTYYRNVEAVILCFDLHNRNTFESLSHWVNEIREVNEKCHLFLVGNKSDLSRNVSSEEITEFMETYGKMTYREVSAKTFTQDEMNEAIFTTFCNELVGSNVTLPDPTKMERTYIQPIKRFGCCWIS